MGIYQILNSGEGRIPAIDIGFYCSEVGISDIERMVRLVKFTEGEVIAFSNEERERKSKK